VRALWIVRYCLAASVTVSLTAFALGAAEIIDPGLSLIISVYGWVVVTFCAIACVFLQGLSWKSKRPKDSN